MDADWIIELFKSSGFITFMVSCGITLVCRAVQRVFRAGITFKTELATKEEQKNFEDEIKKDLISYKEEVTKVVMTTLLKIIDERLKNVQAIFDTANDMKTIAAVLETKLKQMDEKYNEIYSMQETIKIMNNKLMRLEYGESTQTAQQRRVEK